MVVRGEWKRLSEHSVSYAELVEGARSSEKRALDLLKHLVGFPSVASRDKSSIVDCANFVEDQLKEFGYATSQFPTKGSPIVLGEKNIKAEKTLLFYHHYDVEPEDPTSLWTSPPWMAIVRDGRVYGRGTTDNKGPLVANLFGMDLIERALGELPVNVKFLIEGEEEVGSEHLRDFGVAKGDFLKADGCIIEAATATPGHPSEIECGAKGFIDIELTAGGSPRFPQRDVHSGLASGVPNAPWRLVWALNSLKDESENILIEGVDDLVAKPSEEDLAVLREFGEDMTEMIKKDYVLSRTLLGRSGLDLLQAVYMKPSITICGLTSGYQGPGSKMIVPSTASAKVDFRLVPNLTARKAEEMVRAHFIKKGFDDIEVRFNGVGYDPARTPVNHPFIRMVQELSNEVAAPARARLVPSSFGCGPNYLFAPHAPCCMAISDTEMYGTNFHAPDENLPLSSLTSIMAFAAILAERLATM